MSNCSQNCWIDWNSAVLCFKTTCSQRGRPMNVCPICEASLSDQKSASSHRFLSQPITRNRRHFMAWNTILQIVNIGHFAIESESQTSSPIPKSESEGSSIRVRVTSHTSLWSTYELYSYRLLSTFFCTGTLTGIHEKVLDYKSSWESDPARGNQRGRLHLLSIFFWLSLHGGISPCFAWWNIEYRYRYRYRFGLRLPCGIWLPRRLVVKYFFHEYE